MFGKLPKEVKKVIQRILSFSPIMRFILNDKDKRLFWVERMCYVSAIDDWIVLEGQKPLKDLVEEFVPHIGQESFFGLF